MSKMLKEAAEGAVARDAYLASGCHEMKLQCLAILACTLAELESCTSTIRPSQQQRRKWPFGSTYASICPGVISN